MISYLGGGPWLDRSAMEIMGNLSFLVEGKGVRLLLDGGQPNLTITGQRMLTSG